MDKNLNANNVNNNSGFNCNISQINRSLAPNSNNINNNMNSIKNLNNIIVNRSHQQIKDNFESNESHSSMSSQTNDKSHKMSGHSSHQRSASYLNNCNNNSSDPLLDRTPCGSATLTPHFDESYDTPPYIRWQQDFHYLMNDSEGIQLFQKYLKSEGMEQLLDFWFACEGLKTNETEDIQTIKKLISIIYKKFVRNSKVIELSEEVRLALKQGLTSDFKLDSNCDSKYNKNVFDSAQNEVEEQLKSSIYVNFLRSDIYLNYLQSNALGAVGGVPYDKIGAKDSANCGTDCSISSSLESSLDDYNLRNTQNNQFYDLLPTVDEESELQTIDSMVNKSTSNTNTRSQVQKYASIPVNPCHNLMSSGANDTLMRGINKFLSQKSADSTSARLTTESHPLSSNQNRFNSAYQSYYRSKSMSNPPNPYHVKYATVLPASARDSELQSISSHSTNDSMSCVSGHNDGTDSSAIRTKKQQHFAIKHNAKLNSNANNMSATNLSLPLRPPKALPPTANDASNPDKFALMLIEKLEKIKKERDSHESNDKKLAEVLQLAYNEPNANKTNASARQPSTNTIESTANRLKEVLKERVLDQKLEFCPPEENDQEILDKHFAQVFSETPNETPTDSIGRCASPPKSHNFRAYDNRMTPPIGSQVGYESTQVGVIVKYSTEPIPYRLILTGPQITLRKFKQISKRGNWVHYFKRKCTQKEAQEFGGPFILENINDDNKLLPLIDGKIYAELQESN